MTMHEGSQAQQTSVALHTIFRKPRRKYTGDFRANDHSIVTSNIVSYLMDLDVAMIIASSSSFLGKC